MSTAKKAPPEYIVGAMLTEILKAPPYEMGHGGPKPTVLHQVGKALRGAFQAGMTVGLHMSEALRTESKTERAPAEMNQEQALEVATRVDTLLRTRAGVEGRTLVYTMRFDAADAGGASGLQERPPEPKTSIKSQDQDANMAQPQSK